MPTPCYVIAVLGQSPAILTELLWWLIVQEDHDVLGLEVWTTDSPNSRQTGAFHLENAIRDGLWDDLRASVGDRAGCLPDLPLRATPVVPPEVSGLSLQRRLWSMVVFQRAGVPLGDIRTPEDGEAVAAQLHDRVQQLRQSLPESVSLFGSLAGGRKTMSAAMQSAFTLQGRPGDRLLHVLTHHRIEDDRDLLRAFRMPSAAIAEKTGVPMAQQVMVHDVRFPMLRALLPNPALLANTEALSYDALWGRLGEVQRRGAQHSARLFSRSRGKKWCLQILAGAVVVEEITLTPADAETYAAIAYHTQGATDEEWYTWMLRPESRLSWRGRQEPEPWSVERGVDKNVQVRVSRLSGKLNALGQLGCHEFCVETRGRQRIIPAAARVHVEPEPLR